MSVNLCHAVQAFKSFFGDAPELGARAPGRVNIIGEHTDYNHGFVLPMAIEHDTLIVGKLRADRMLRVRAENLGRDAATNLEQRERNPDEPWMDYIVGVADELVRLDCPIRGADMLVLGDVPVGCGLSSSASLEMAALCFFEQLGEFALATAEAARLGQRVENCFLGLSTGIMDQFISRAGKEGHALFLDCRTFDFDLVPIAMQDVLFVIANTACPRRLAASKYNERVAECRAAVKAMESRFQKGGTHLRDFSLEDLEQCRTDMPEVCFRRARHVLTENERTLAARDAMRAGDAEWLGNLMIASDQSLREDYEVTSSELDVMTRAARALPGCLGARMTGAGFGGCTINLVRRDHQETFRRSLMEMYLRETGNIGETFLSVPAAGASALDPP